MISFSRHSLLPLAVVAILLFCATVPAETSGSYAQAEAFVRRGQWDQGLTLLEQILQAEPKNLKALNLKGIALTGKGDLPSADREFKRALEIDARFYPALKNLGINECTEKNTAAGEKHLSQALAFLPNDPVIHAYLGEIAYSRKQYREATTHLAKSGKLRDDPRIAEMLIESYLETGGRMQALEALKGVQPGKLSAPSQFALGLALARHDLSREAVPYFQAIAEAHPESYDAAFNLALCAMQSGEFTLAIDTLQEAVRNGHETAELDNLLAEAYAGNKQIQPAIDALRKATRLAPEDENNYLDLAALCANYDAYDVGLEVLDVGLRYHPQSDRLIFQRGVLQAMKNKFDLAEKDFQLAASLAPNKNLSYVALGVSYMQTGKLPEAIQSLRQRTKEKPNDPLLHYLLGDALIRSGAAPGDATFTEAKAELETSVRLKPDLAASQVDLGKIYIKESRWDDALQHLERARQLDPRDKTAYSQLAIVYRRTGKSQLASAALATLNQINEQERFDDQRERLRIIEQPASSQPRP